MTFHPKRLIGPSSITDTGVVRYDSTVGSGTLVSDSGVTISDDGNLAVSGDTTIGGNLIVDGYQIVTQGENVLFSDNHIYLNAGYTVPVAQTGGLVVNYLPTALSTLVENEYIAGLEGIFNPSVFTDGYHTFSPDDFIQISLPNGDGYNEGLFEVLDHDGYILTIRGIGTDSTVEDFTQNQFVEIATDGATITKVNVSIIRSGSDGVWESAFGSSNGLVFADFSAGGGGVTGGGSNDQLAVWSSGTSIDGSTGLTFNGSILSVTGNILPGADDTYDLGADTLRWKDGYFGPGTLHIGTSVSDEAQISYNATTNNLVISTGIDVQGAMSVITSTITTSTALTASHNVVLSDSSGGEITITLPAVATSAGRKYHIKKVDSSSNNVVVDGQSSETIDGELTQTLTLQYESLTIVNDGSEWFII